MLCEGLLVLYLEIAFSGCKTNSLSKNKKIQHILSSSIFFIIHSSPNLYQRAQCNTDLILIRVWYRCIFSFSKGSSTSGVNLVPPAVAESQKAMYKRQSSEPLQPKERSVCQASEDELLTSGRELCTNRSKSVSEFSFCQGIVVSIANHISTMRLKCCNRLEIARFASFSGFKKLKYNISWDSQRARPGQDTVSIVNTFLNVTVGKS